MDVTYRPGNQLHGEEGIPGSDVLTPNASYELTKITQKRQASHGHVDLERNPAYATVMSSPHANT